MLQIVYSTLAFVVAIGLLISIHEFGHFWVAKRLGIKVLKFSIGFGKPLISWHDKLGTEYVIAAVPLGGYVKMLDQNEGIVAPNELHRAFNNKPIWVRMAVIAAGPISNLLFAVFAYWLMYLIGIASIVPVLGDIPKGSVAQVAGLRSGQEIIAVADEPTPTWEDIAMALMSQVGDSNFINVKVRDAGDNTVSNHALNLTNWSLDNNDENIIKNLGLEPLDPVAPIVGQTLSGMPAEKAGLKAGDRIISLNGNYVNSRAELMSALKDHFNHPVNLQILRDDQKINVAVTPEKKILDGGSSTGFIGIQFAEQSWPEQLIRLQRYTPMVALNKAFGRTAEYTVLTLQFLRKMVVGQMSLQHVAGPISIAKFAGRTAVSGPEYFLGFLALVSISLGVLNLLPIPVLDGGHLMFCIVEMIRGKSLSSRALQICNMFGFVVLGSFMILAVYNDIVRVFY